MKKNLNLGLLILRLTVGVLMLLHGIAKVSHGVKFIEGQLAAKNLPEFLAYGVYVGEILAPIFIIFGIMTRLSALVLIINCIVAALLFHANEIFSLSQHGGWAIENLGLYTLGALVLYFTGGGKYSIKSNGKWD
ncbi:DoxX family protein [Aureivirga sp. CE67]|uniref:DoxX family protein n=1 Tax=Aureivirga sp. CE67 TaxID=1788983 RepID=UPI0018C9C128|nr:DoxX family protein [Aureivirga sp. CE67]